MAQGGVPLVARACLNYLKRQEKHADDVTGTGKFSKENAFCRAGVIQRGKVDLPVLLGSEVKLVGSQTIPDACGLSPTPTSPTVTPVSDATSLNDRSLSFRSNTSFEYSVKNTFVHVDERSDSDSYPELTRSASEPRFFKIHPCATTQPIGRSSLSSLNATPPQVEACRESLVSIGSVAHGQGNCRPCAWFWKAGGCENGAECRHCHLCPEDEIKRRRQVKVAERKKLLACFENPRLHQDVAVGIERTETRRRRHYAS